MCPPTPSPSQPARSRRGSSTGKAVKSSPSPGAQGNQIAAAGKDGSARIWNLAQDGPSSPLILHGHDGEVWSVAFDPDGRSLASGGADRMVRIWNTSTGLERRSFQVAASRVNAIAYSRDGKLLATASLDGPLGLWDPSTGKPVSILRGHAEPVFELAFSGDGTRLLSAGQQATMKLWDLTSEPGLRLFRIPDRAEVRHPALHAAAARPLVRWVGGVAFRPDGSQLAAAGTEQTVAIWSYSSGLLEQVLQAPRGAAFALSYSHDGTRLAFAGSDRSARIFDLKALAGDPLLLSDHAEGIASVAFSRDGKTIATGGGDPPIVIQAPHGKVAPSEGENRGIRLWDAATGSPQRTLNGHVGSIHAVAFSPDGKRLFSAGSDRCVRIWDLDGGAELSTLKEHTGTIFTLALSPDGTKLAAAGEDRTISYWDLAANRLICKLEGHKNWVMGLAFNRDGMRLASAGADQTVRIWDLPRGRELLTLRGPEARVHGVAFSPDGSSLAAASADGLVRLWGSRPDPLGGIEAHQDEVTADDAEMPAHYAGTTARPSGQARSRPWAPPGESARSQERCRSLGKPHVSIAP